MRGCSNRALTLLLVVIFPAWSWDDDASSRAAVEELASCGADHNASAMLQVQRQRTEISDLPEEELGDTAAATTTTAKTAVGKNCQHVQTPTATCELMLMSSFFTTRKDWQREEYVEPSFSKFEKLYQTVFDLGLNMTVIYDDLPDEIVKDYGCERWRWEKVNLDDYEAKYGVNDVRYFFFERLLDNHPEWKYLFVIDAFDVMVEMNPCPALQPGKLYVGSEPDELKGHPWMEARYFELGGKYNDWYNMEAHANMSIMNCGITGGHRDTMLQLFRKMTGVLSDPNLACRKANEDINVNMAALNYVVYNSFQNEIVTGAPVHSLYKRLEVERKDVWFIHKL